MTEIKSVAIVGAGLVGRAALTALLKTTLKITVISRLDSKSVFPDSVAVIKTTYDLPSLTAAFKGQDAVLVTVNASAVSQEHDLVDAAVGAGVKWFIPSEYGHDTTNEKVLSMGAVFRSKAAVVAHLKGKEKSMSWTAVITGLFFDWGMEYNFLGFDTGTKTATLWDRGRTSFSTVNVSSIGVALATLLTSPSALEAARNRYIFISSVKTNQLEILAALEEVTNDKYTVENMSSAESLPVEIGKVGRGDWSSIGSLLRGIQFGEAALADFGQKTEKWNRLLKLDSEESVSETVKRVVKAKK